MNADAQIATAKMLLNKRAVIDAIATQRGGSYPGMNIELESIGRQLGELLPEHIAIAKQELATERTNDF